MILAGTSSLVALVAEKYNYDKASDIIETATSTFSGLALSIGAIQYYYVDNNFIIDLATIKKLVPEITIFFSGLSSITSLVAIEDDDVDVSESTSAIAAMLIFYGAYFIYSSKVDEEIYDKQELSISGEKMELITIQAQNYDAI